MLTQTVITVGIYPRPPYNHPGRGLTPMLNLMVSFL